ncbi:MAG: TIR domain-containing protein [Ruminococcus sp.]|nr:TIR domain-containing protein [Ruminococcus sp.]
MDYKYKAFISYRHLEPDMQAAERLQKLLESYKPPKNIGKTKENWRIFRDVSELQSSSDLSEDIKNAIETSEYLIVICSPKYTESKWCMQELTRFRELHDGTNKNIITLLVSGEPQESFPEELTYTEMTTTNEKGEEVKVKVEVEPLAANIKADTLKESMKKLNTEYLRIAAPLLGCDFNDLFQREKRREAARRRRIFGGVSGILSLITVISVASAVTISGKNVQIKKQNSQIKEQNEQIAQKNSDLLIENAGHLAVESENLFKENSLIPAIQKAVAALPADGEDKPALPEAEYALSRELGMFKHSQLTPKLALRHDCAVEQLSFMGGGRSVVSQDATGVYFWDAETGALIKKISATDSEFASEAGGSSNKLTAYLDVSRDKTGTYYESTSTPSSISYENSSVFNKIYTNFVHSVDDDEPGTGGDVYIYNSDSTVWRLDGATGEVKWKAAPSEKANTYYSVEVDEEYVLRLYQDKKVMPNGLSFPGSDVYLELIDRETGNVVDDVRVTDASGATFAFLMDLSIQTVRDGVIYIYSENDSAMKAFEIKDHSVELRNEVEVTDPTAGGVHSVTMQFMDGDPLITSCGVLAFNTKTTFTRYDSELGEAKWSAELPINYMSGGMSFLIPAADSGYDHDVLAVLTKLTLSFIDYEDGSVIKYIPFDSEVVDASFSRNGLVMFTVREGGEYVVSLGHYTTGNSSDNAAYRVQKMNTAVSLCSYSRSKYATADNYSNTAYIQYVEQNPMYTDIDAGEYMYRREVLAVSDGGGYAAVSAAYYPDGKYNGGSDIIDHLFLYDIGNKKLTEVEALKNYEINSAAFVGKDTLIVDASEKTSGYASTSDEVFVVNIADATAKAVENAPSASRSTVKLISTEAGAYYLADSDRNLVLVAPDGKYTSWATATEGSFGSDKQIINKLCAVSGSRAAIYAQFNNEDGKTALIVHDFSLGQHVTLEFDPAADEGLEVLRIFWMNDETVGVFFSDRTVVLYDASSGKPSKTITLDATSQEPISVIPFTSNSFAVLCRDSCLYEMNEDGFTGRSCRLEFADESGNDIRESDSSSADKLSVQPTMDGFPAFVIWNGSQAWYVDEEWFKVRYRIDGFAGAPADGTTVFIKDSDRNKIGFFPIYSTTDLLDAAKKYLSALGEV